MKSTGSNAQLIREVIAMSDVARRDDPAQREAVQEFPRRDPRPYRRPAEPPASGETFANQASSIVQRVAVTSVSEIDRLIAELETLREFLRQEGGLFVGKL